MKNLNQIKKQFQEQALPMFHDARERIIEKIRNGEFTIERGESKNNYLRGVIISIDDMEVAVEDYYNTVTGMKELSITRIDDIFGFGYLHLADIDNAGGNYEGFKVPHSSEELEIINDALEKFCKTERSRKLAKKAMLEKQIEDLGV